MAHLAAANAASAARESVRASIVECGDDLPVKFCFLICQNDRIGSRQILTPFTSCYHTCSTYDPSLELDVVKSDFQC